VTFRAASNGETVAVTFKFQFALLQTLEDAHDATNRRVAAAISSACIYMVGLKGGGIRRATAALILIDLALVAALERPLASRRVRKKRGGPHEIPPPLAA